jgi:hypothetical protein
MKKGLAALMVSLLVLCTGCGGDAKTKSAGGRSDIFLVVASSLEAGKLEEARRFILHTLFEVMEGGDRLTVFDAASEIELAQFAYPDVDLKTTRLKKNYVEKEWVRFLAHCAKMEAGMPRPVEGGLHLPRIGRMLADRMVAERRERTEVILIGSPFHTDRNPEFSFGRDEWLSDAVFVQDTPFQVPATDKNRFAGVRLHFVFLENPFVDPKHQDKVQRFWSLWTSLQGGSLVTFTSDIKAYRRIKSDIEVTRYELDPADTLVVARRSVAETAVAKTTPLPAPGEKIVISVRYENKAADIDLVAELAGQRLDFKTAAPFGMHKKHLVTGSEEIVTGLHPDLNIKLEHVNGPPPGKVLVSIFSENGERLAGLEYDGFKRWTSYNLQKQEASFKISDLLSGNTADFGVGG